VAGAVLETENGGKKESRQPVAHMSANDENAPADPWSAAVSEAVYDDGRQVAAAGVLQVSEVIPSLAGDNDRKRPAQGATITGPKRSRTTHKSEDSPAAPAGRVAENGGDAAKSHTVQEAPEQREIGTSAMLPIEIDNDIEVKVEGGAVPIRENTVAEKEIYYALTTRELDSDESKVLGFITAAHDDTFSELRVLVQDQLELPRDLSWNFYFPSLGPVSVSQERHLGPVAERLEKAACVELGDGELTNPFRLSIVYSKDGM